MNLLILAGTLAVLAFVLAGPFSVWLSGVDWVARAPRSSVFLWQCTGLGALVSGIGAGIAVAVYRYHVGFVRGLEKLFDGLVGGHPLQGLGLYDALGLTLAADLIIVLCALVATLTIRTLRQRARHRRLVDLLARRSVMHPGTQVLTDNRAIAYCLPGLRARIVVSDGTLRLLGAEEVEAVIEHERGHAHGRHGLVLLPMVSLRELFAWIPYAKLAPREMASLLEMAADDFASRRSNRHAMAAALVEMATVHWAPNCALALCGSGVSSRVDRLLASSPPTSKRAMYGSVLLAVGAVAVPASLLLLG